MKRRRADDREEDEADPGHPFRASVFWTILLAAILYTGLYIVVRLDGFRVYMEERLEKRLGLPVTIQRTLATPGLDLVLEQLATRDSDKLGRPGLRARAVRLEWSLAGLILPGRSVVRRLVLKGPSISFAPRDADAGGGWEPASAERLGSWLAEWAGFQEAAGPAARGGGSGAGGADAAASKEEIAPGLDASFWERVNLDIEDGRMVWWDAAGVEQASADGLRLQVTQLEAPNRRLTHYHLFLEQGRLGGGRQVRQFTFEMLQAGDQKIVLALTAEGGAP